MRSGCYVSFSVGYIAAMSKVEESFSARSPRVDAVRNRAAILTAASAVFATHGGGVDVREIARCAGVGMGTLYRHFPTKEALLETVLHDNFAEWTRASRDAAAAEKDPALALAGFLHDALERQASHRAMVERFAETWNSTDDMATCQRELHPVINDLVARCHNAGTLRAGVTGEDIALLLVALGRITQLANTRDRPHLWQRSLQIALDGLRPIHSSPLPEG